MKIYIEDRIIYISGNLIIKNIDLGTKLFAELNLEIGNYVADLSDVKKIDSSGVAFLDEIEENCAKKDIIISYNNSPKYVIEARKTFGSKDLGSEIIPETKGFFENVGGNFFAKIDAFFYGVFLASEIFYFSIVGIVNKKDQREGTFFQQALNMGVDALPIVGLLSLIIGVILALQAAAQLRQFGANIFVADLIAVSMVREMGPMMTAIIIAGRSGSAIASEIATMKVTEELDALKMMAINPLRYIVVPKFHAMTICMPLLVVFSIVIGIGGGLIVAMSYLDLSMYSYMDEVFKILSVQDLVISMSKSIFFSWVIVIIGSFYGFQVEGGAEGVGKATTFSVVASIFAIIVFDAIFSLAFLPK